MAKEINKEVENSENSAEAMANTVTANKNSIPAASSANMDNGFDYSYERESKMGEDDMDYSVEGETYIYPTPSFVRRERTGRYAKNGLEICNYYFGYAVEIHGVKLSQTVYLTPPNEERETFALLMAIFGDSDTRPLEIVRRDRTHRRGNYSKSVPTYNYRVSMNLPDGTLWTSTLKISSGDTDKSNNYLAKLKTDGYIK